MKKISYQKLIPDEILDIKYATYYLTECSEHVNSDKPKQGYILEDVEELIPESIISYQATDQKFVRSETVMAQQLMKLCQIVKELQSKISELTIQ